MEWGGRVLNDLERDKDRTVILYINRPLQS